MCSSYSFLTSVLEGVNVSVTPRPRFTRGERQQVPVGYEAGWASELVWTDVRGKILALTINEGKTLK
jgi:hypothetical protein